MYEKTIESLLHCAEMLVDEAKRENSSFDSSDRIAAGIARAQSGLEKELEDEEEMLDLRKLSIKKHHLDGDIVLNSADKAYYVRDDDEDDSLTVTIAKNVERADADIPILNENYVVVDKYVDCVFDSSYVIIVSSKTKWTKERYDELSKKIERAVCGEEL